MGGSEKVQNYAGVIYGWSLILMIYEVISKSAWENERGWKWCQFHTSYTVVWAKWSSANRKYFAKRIKKIQIILYYVLRKGLDTVESLSAGAKRLNTIVGFTKFSASVKILASFTLPKICADFYPKLFPQSNGAVVTSSKNLYIGPLVTLRRPRGLRQCRAPSWVL